MGKSCGRCQKDKVVAITLDDSMDVCGSTFTAVLPAEKCGGCGEIVIQGHDMRRFENRVAVEIAKAGLRTPEAFKFLRKSVALEPAQLAELLDVPAEFVGYWEDGAWPMDPRAHSVLASLVIARHDGQLATLDCLRVLRQPRRLGQKVRVHLEGALQVAAKALQFGSAAHGAPALA